jgi:hypothetical protein
MVTAWIVGDLDDPQATELVAEVLTAVVSRASPIAASVTDETLSHSKKTSALALYMHPVFCAHSIPRRLRGSPRYYSSWRVGL